MFGLSYGMGAATPALIPILPCPPKNKAQFDNKQQYFDTFVSFVDLFLNTFEWVRLPETCNARALETTLLFDGKALFFKHRENSGYFNCPFSYVGDQLNFYGEFTTYRTNAPTYQQHEYNETNAVVIRNTPSQFASWVTLDIYARKIYDNARSIDVYQRTMKRPFLISGTKETKVTIETIMRETDENEYFKILNEKAFNADAIKPLPIPQDPKNLYALWDNLHNNQAELFKRLGIQNTNVDKAERLVTAEAEGNCQITSSNIAVLLDSRLVACEQINKLFGLNVSCKLKNKPEEMTADAEPEDETERANNAR